MTAMHPATDVSIYVETEVGTPAGHLLRTYSLPGVHARVVTIEPNGGGSGREAVRFDCESKAISAAVSAFLDIDVGVCFYRVD